MPPQPKKIKSMQSALLDWYQIHRRQLPWRETRDPYPIWVSEVMLQQTQVNRVLPYFKSFLKTFPTVADLARADLEMVLKAWEGLGYYGRARHLHQAARRVVREMDGRIPDRRDEFRKLPGVGDYIASAVQSIAFGNAHAVVDGNVKRVLSRLFLMDAPVNHAASQRSFQKKATLLMGGAEPGRFNQALMELGALICKPRNPLCGACCISQHCLAVCTNQVEDYPKRNERRPVPMHRIATGVVWNNGNVLITRRRPEGLLGGLWEFPGGKIREGEDAGNACIREIHEETNLHVKIDRYLIRVQHAYTHFKIEMDVFQCEYVSGTVRLNGPDAFRWIRLSAIDQYPFPKANHKFIPLLNQK